MKNLIIFLLCLMAFFANISFSMGYSNDILNIEESVEKDENVENVFKNKGEEAAVIFFDAAILQALDNNDPTAYLSLIQDMGYAYLDYMGNNEKAIQILEMAYSLPFELRVDDDLNLQARVFIVLAYTYCNGLGKYEDAIKPFNQAFDIYENKLNDKSIYRALYLEKYLGNIFTRLGDYDAAEVHLKYALNIFLDNKEYDKAALVTSDLGLLYQSWEKPELVGEVYQRGLSFPIKDVVSKIALLINYSDHLLENGEDEKALIFIEDVNEILRQNLDNDYLNRHRSGFQAGIFTKEAKVFHNKGEREKAYEKLIQAIQEHTSYYETKYRREIAKLHNKAASIKVEMGNFELAIQGFQNALECVLPAYKPCSLFELPSSDLFYAENTILESLNNIALAYQAWFEINGNVQLLETALECYHLIIDVEGHLRRSYMYENSKLFNLEESQQRSEEVIALAYQLYKITDNKQYLYQAFTFAERNRSSLLREALRSSKAINELGLSEVELEKEKELAYQVSQAQENWFKLQGEVDVPDSLIQATNQALLSAKDAQKKWVDALEAEHPRYYQLKYNDALPSIESYQAMLQSDQLMLEYFVGKEHLYVFAIDKKGIQLHQLSIPENLTQKVLSWRKSIVDYQYPTIDKTQLMVDYRQLGHELYNDLMHIVLAAHKGYDQLLIVPSGILDLLPFEALLHENVETNTTLKQYPYLLNDFTISYAYSATLYHSLLQLERKGEGLGAFAPSFDESEAWPALVCATNLFKNLKTPWNKEAWLNKDATTQRFREIAGKYQVLHLATHAQANAEFGDFSFILLHNEQGGYDSLFAKDLYLLDIDAELVILSACETALGTLYNSEGVISLARAFHYAGARSILTTLWRINEGANCDLMEYFYDELADNPSKPLALQQAKQRYIENADARDAHPVYWAGFQFSGNPRPVDEPSNLVWYFLGGFLLIFFGFLYKNQAKEKVEIGEVQLSYIS